VAAARAVAARAAVLAAAVGTTVGVATVAAGAWAAAARVTAAKETGAQKGAGTAGPRVATRVAAARAAGATATATLEAAARLAAETAAADSAAQAVAEKATAGGITEAAMVPGATETAARAVAALERRAVAAWAREVAGVSLVVLAQARAKREAPLSSRPQDRAAVTKGSEPAHECSLYAMCPPGLQYIHGLVADPVVRACGVLASLVKWKIRQSNCSPCRHGILHHREIGDLALPWP
jgi:hypothetical protein